MRSFAHTALVIIATSAAALLVAGVSAAVLGFTHAALFIAGISAAVLATRRAAQLLQLPLI